MGTDKAGAARMAAIEAFGDRYVRDFLGEHALESRYTYGKRQLLEEWWPGLRFFFGHSFYRGRADKLSYRFEKRAIDVLKSWFGELAGTQVPTVNTLGLDEELLRNGVNNHADRNMVVDAVNFAVQLPGGNLVGWAATQVEKGRIQEAYARLDALRSVGRKIASLYLRDVVLLYDLRASLKGSDLTCVQPIDTWVRQVCGELGINPVTEEMINETCITHGVDPLKFNAGAWYVGTRAFEIVLSSLPRLDANFVPLSLRRV